MPPPPQALCPPEAVEATPAEPLPPKGISTAALHTLLQMSFGDAGDQMFQWFAVDHPTWARSLAGRLDVIKADCAKQESKP